MDMEAVSAIWEGIRKEGKPFLDLEGRREAPSLDAYGGAFVETFLLKEASLHGKRPVIEIPPGGEWVSSHGSSHAKIDVSTLSGTTPYVEIRGTVSSYEEEGEIFLASAFEEECRLLFAHGLVPIIHPRVEIRGPSKKKAEHLLHHLLMEKLFRLQEEGSMAIRLDEVEDPTLFLDFLDERGIKAVFVPFGQPGFIRLVQPKEERK